MQEGPDRRGTSRKSLRRLLVHSRPAQRRCSAGMRCLQGPARAVDDGEGHQLRDPPPAAPAVELGQVVRPHDPHEPHPRRTTGKVFEAVEGIAGADLGLKARHREPRMPGERPRRRHALGQGRKPAELLQRVAGGDKPPDAV